VLPKLANCDGHCFVEQFHELVQNLKTAANLTPVMNE